MKATGTSNGDPCRGLGVLVDIAKPLRGGDVGYSVFHAYRLLVEACEKPVGRPRLSRLLGLGESSAKTLLRRLREKGLLSETGRGHRATILGCSVASTVSSLIEVSLAELGSLELGEASEWGRVAIIATRAMDPPTDLVSVYRIRDELVAEGCRAAIIGGVNRGVYTFPGIPDNIASRLASIARNAGIALDRGLLVFVREDDLPRGFSSVLGMVYRTVCGQQ